jgi:hypothetical protein
VLHIKLIHTGLMRFLLLRDWSQVIQADVDTTVGPRGQFRRCTGNLSNGGGVSYCSRAGRLERVQFLYSAQWNSIQYIINVNLIMNVVPLSAI